MAVKKDKVKEPEYTDILQEFFMDGEVEMVKKTYMNGDKFVKEEIEKS